nr:hypothetical protein [Tanacetum cinerariifolium]
MLSFDLGDKIEVTPSKIHDMLGVPFGGYSLFDLDEREADHEFVRKWAGQFYPLELKKVHADGLKGQICLDVVRRRREDYSTKFDKFPIVRTRPAIRNWSSYLMKQRQELELKDHVDGPLDLQDEWNEAEVQESEGFIGFLKTFKKEEASLKCPGDEKFVALHEKYVNLFKDLISFKDNGNGDNVDDDENGDDDGGNVDNNANDYDGNRDKEEVNEGDKDPNGSNPSFGFSKISLANFGNDSGPAEKDKVVEGNPTEQGTSKPHEIHSESHVIYSESHVIYSESHVINSESHVIHFESHSKSMFNGTLASFDAKWESFSNQVNVQFKGNKGGLALGGIDLYGHIRHTQVAKVKHTILKLKWKTKENFHDCGIFTMLHMKTFDGGPASNLNFGLPMESQLQRDMLRRLRFKFATKILLHEINVHAGKMLELEKEFDKTNPVEKIAIIVDAFKKREERDCI